MNQLLLPRSKIQPKARYETYILAVNKKLFLLCGILGFVYMFITASLSPGTPMLHDTKYLGIAAIALVICLAGMAAPSNIVLDATILLYVGLYSFAQKYAVQATADPVVYYLPLAVIMVLVPAAAYISTWRFMASAITVWAVTLSGDYARIFSHLEINYVISTAVASLLFGAIIQQFFERLRSRVFLIGLQLSNMAYIDALTGIGNRRFFYEAMNKRDAQQADPYCLLMIDIDNFKRVNDRFGHEGGDEVLKLVAFSLTDVVGSHVFARLGGEEFIVALHEDPADCVRMAQSIVDAVTGIESEYGTLTVSVGISYQVTDSDLSAALRSADEALYRAKSAGKNRWCN